MATARNEWVVALDIDRPTVNDRRPVSLDTGRQRFVDLSDNIRWSPYDWPIERVAGSFASQLPNAYSLASDRDTVNLWIAPLCAVVGDLSAIEWQYFTSVATKLRIECSLEPVFRAIKKEG